MVVSDIVVHPEYNHSVYINDIAVLKLLKLVTVTNFVRPCCLWENPNSNNANSQKGARKLVKVMDKGSDVLKFLLWRKKKQIIYEKCKRNYVAIRALTWNKCFVN